MALAPNGMKTTDGRGDSRLYCALSVVGLLTIGNGFGTKRKKW
jgi:hypothetical protein